MNIVESKIKTKDLHYKCRLCPFYESVSAPAELLIFNRLSKKNPGSNSLALKDFPLDVTLPRVNDVKCPKCEYPEAVSMISDLHSDKKITHIYVCARRDQDNVCGFSWHV